MIACPYSMKPNWNMCLICQQETTEPLKCPLQNQGTGDDKTEAYRYFLANVQPCLAISALPTNISFGNIGGAAFSSAHRISWHKSCHLKYDKSCLLKYDNFKLKKVTKRRSCTGESERRPSQRQAMTIELAFTWASLKEDQVSARQ